MAGGKKKTKLSPRSKAYASPSPSPAVSVVHASGESSLPAGEPNLHVHQTSSPGPVDEPLNSSVVASSSVSRQSSETKQRGHNSLSTNDVEKPLASRWFLRTGTWPRASKKSTAVTQVAQENASGTSTTPPASIREELSVEIPAIISGTADNRSSLALAIPEPAMTKKIGLPVPQTPGVPPSSPGVAETEPPTGPTEIPEDTKNIKDANVKDGSSDVSPDDPAAVAGSYWFGWWYGAPVPPEFPEAPKSEASEEQIDEPTAIDIQIAREPTPPPPPPPPLEPVVPDPVPPELSEVPSLDGSTDIASAPVSAPIPKSWFGFWGQEPPAAAKVENEIDDLSKSTTETSQNPSPSGSQTIPRTETNSTPVTETSAAAATKQSDTKLLGAQINPPVPPPPTPNYAETETSSVASITPGRPSGWAFWSGGRSKSVEFPSSSSVSSAATVGQLAVADTPSQLNPQKAKVKEIKIPPSAPVPVSELKTARTISNLREEARPNTPKKDTGASTVAAASTVTTSTTPQSSASEASSTATQTPKKAISTNHVLPVFESCYRRQIQPSILCQITKVFKSQVPHSKRHLYLAPAPLRIRKAVAIGVHGFFPMRLVRTVLGEPTGTSIRFANSAAAAIKRWAEKNNVEVEIEKIALEGEGKVGDRVEMLWKLLSNWMDHVKTADFVLLAAHSQGVVVGVQLLARLIEEGCVKEKARIGFTAMAGINLGPFYHLPTTILTGSAKELFEFQKPESAPSQKYIQALEVILRHNVRVLYVGSIDDQLVPLESSSFSNISHPYIFRAVFVDGRVHAPDFLSHLVGFAMKLRNQGISDHGLIRELSSPLAGSLYGGEGHSRIYDDEQVYDLGVRHALETTDCGGVAMKVEPFELPTNANNPFFLPWSMRGMLEEPHVKDRLRGECMQLLEQFENWKPNSKVLKDVKFRLEGIRSKL